MRAPVHASGFPHGNQRHDTCMARDGRRPIALKEDFSGMIKWNVHLLFV